MDNSVASSVDSLSALKNESKDRFETRAFFHRSIDTLFRKMYLAALAAMMSAVAMGMTIGFSSPATEEMSKANSRPVRISNDDKTWVGSLVPLGALFGGIAAAFMTNLFGRKGTLIISSLPIILGCLLISYAPNKATIFAGRFLSGISCGLVTVTVPMYSVEISTTEVRGIFGAGFQLSVTIGILLAVSLGSILSWPWLSIACCIPPILGLIFICLMPESPKWLISKNKPEKAMKAISFLQGKTVDSKQELASLQETMSMEPKGGLTLKEIMQPIIFKPALLSLALMFFQQFSGINAIMFYTESIFKSAGSSLKPSLAVIIVAIVQVCATLAGSMCMDKVGRRILILISGCGMFVSLLTMGIYFFLRFEHESSENSYGWIPLVSLVLFIVFFSVGYGPIPFFMFAEMIPVRARSLFGGIATGFNWALAFTVTKTFDSMQAKFHDHGTYWFYASICLTGCIFIWFLLPETKGKSLEEIQRYFTKTQDSTEEIVSERL